MANDKECLDNACRDVAAAATGGGWQLAVAESCTGGLVAASLTAMAGASKWFSFGAVVYANSAKVNILAVPEEVLQKHGAVSEQTAAKMCEGAMTILAKNNNGDNADKGNKGDNVKLMTIAITGIAGPGGDGNNKPIGTICFGWQTNHPGEQTKDNNNKNQQPTTETRHFPGTRQSIRLQSAIYALQKAATIMRGG